MIQLFFPSSLFAWSFSAVLLALLAAASYTDLRRMVIPKWITLTTLAFGVLASLAPAPTWARSGCRPGSCRPAAGWDMGCWTACCSRWPESR